MEEHEPSHRISNFLKTYKEFCYIVLKQSFPFSTTAFWVCNSVIILQVLTLILIPHINTNLPWSSPSLQTIWILIACISRPDFFGYYFDEPLFFTVCFLIIFSIYLSARLIMLYMILKRIGLDARSVQALDKLTKSELLKFDSLYRYILFEIGLIPMLNITIEFPSILLENSSSIYLTVCMLAPFTILCIEDSMCYQLVFYTKNPRRELISMPFYVVLRRAGIFIVVLGVQCTKYPGNWFIYATILFSVGVYLAYHFSMNQPYYSNWMNGVEICKGIMLAWGGLLLYLINLGGYQVESPELTSCVFFIPLPFMAYLAIEFMNYRHKMLLRQDEIITDTQLFHILISDAISGSSNPEPLKETIKAHMKKFNDSIYINLWLFSYFLSNSQHLQAKILISKIETNNHSWLLTSYRRFLIEKLKEFTKNLPEETDAEQYIRYSYMISTTLSQDSYICRKLDIFYSELLFRKPKSSTLSSTISQICTSLSKTHNMYKTLIQMFSKDSRLLDYYSGFLDSIMNSRKAKHYQQKSFKAAKFDLPIISSGSEVNFYDLKTTMMIVSLSASNLGQILWVTNAVGLGYADYELELSNFRMIIPEPLSSRHDVFLRRSMDIWTRHRMLTSVISAFVVNRNQCLVAVYLAVRMVLMKNGKLAILTAIKVKPDGIICGFLSMDGRYITSAASQLSLFMSSILNIEEDKLKSVDLLELAGIKEWQPNFTICEGFSHYSNSYLYVRTSENAISISPTKTIVLTDKSTFHSDFNILTTQQFYSSSSSLIHTPISTKSTSAHSSNITESPNIKMNNAKAITIDNKYNHEYSSFISSSLHIKDSVKEMLSLKGRVSRNLNKKVMYLVVGIVIFGTVTIALFIVIGVIHSMTVQESYESSQLVSVCAEVSLSAAHLASSSKELYLYDIGIGMNNSREDILNIIKIEAESLLENFRDIYDSYGDHKYSEKIYKGLIIYWIYREGILENELITLLEFTKRISSFAQNLAGSTNSTSNLQDVIELYSNGNSQVFRSLNSTMFDAIDSTSNYISFKFSILNWLTLISVGVMIIAIILLVIFPLYKIHILRKELWNLIFSIPNSILHSGYIKVRDRLHELHGEEIAEPIILRKNRNNKYSSSRLQIHLYIYLGILVSSIITYLMIINFIEIPRIVSILKENTHMIAWIELKNIYAYNMIYMLREQAYPMKLYISNTYSYSSHEELTGLLQDSHFASSKVQETDNLSDSIFEALYETSPDYKYGYHSFELDLFRQVEHTSQMLKHQQVSYSLLNGPQLEQDIYKYFNSTSSIKDRVINEFNQQMEGMINLYLTFTVIALGLMGLFVIFAIFPVIYLLRKQISYEIKVLVLLPKENIQFVISAFHSILDI